MVGPQYEDLLLADEHVQRVRDYIRSINFHLPGATPDDFEINRRARYLGYMFQQEDLESYGVGLKCMRPGMEGQNTFIRMSRDQLLGNENPKILPVNEPVLGAEAMTLNRFYDTPAGPTRTGIDTFANDEGLPGGDMDLSMLEQQLADIIAFHNGQPVPGNQEILDLRVFWGSLMGGRYPRLKHFQKAGQLSPTQEDRLNRLESEINAVSDILESLGLATLETLQTKPVRNG